MSINNCRDLSFQQSILLFQLVPLFLGLEELPPQHGQLERHLQLSDCKSLLLDEVSEEGEGKDSCDLFLLLLKKVAVSSSKPLEGRSSTTVGGRTIGTAVGTMAEMTAESWPSQNLKRF
ncbi:unnamed protein product [Ilex paraguariensis]|uniref:Uncharacterized protein n=1 Tax=Ilex paraguariensis TaxID=185542 RepID=A0ABC8SI23_9AQUA